MKPRRSQLTVQAQCHHELRNSGSGSTSTAAATNDTRAQTVNSHLTKQLLKEDFVGIARLRLIRAEMKFKDKWLSCVTLGEQTFRTAISDQTDKPVWNSEKKLLLERKGAHVARISVFETNRLSKNNLIGYCETDLFEIFTQESDFEMKVDLKNPSAATVVGSIYLSCSIEDPIETEKSFARRILSIVFHPGSVSLGTTMKTGNLSFAEFSDLIDAFGNQLAANKKEELFKAADEDGNGVVSMDELAMLLVVQQEKNPLINCCPVCGEVLKVSDRLNTMIHLTLCFDEGTGNQVMTGGILD
ncbi:Phosphatidylserine decarboxylase proenzyme 2 [Forsythia ovata]|uniref:Phosphatidylserine decarboxylase proenzyme 2 n=1 Tax=Forsythia ovata TaxID=205694 RepID=A0ABD1VI93_9LAMI